MKKILAAVLAVALVAVVYVGVNHTPAAPVEDDAAIVNAAAPVKDEAPAEAPKTAVLGDVVSDIAPLAETPAEEPGDGDGDDKNTEGEGEGEPEDKTEDKDDDEAAAPVVKKNPRIQADVSPKDSVTIDSEGTRNNTSVSVYASSPSGDLVFDNGTMYELVDDTYQAIDDDE